MWAIKKGKKWNFLLVNKLLCIHATGFYVPVCTTLLQSCLTLGNSMDGSPPGSSAHGILQARILEWVAVASSKICSQARDQTCVSCLLHWQADPLPLVLPGKPIEFYITVKMSKSYVHPHPQTASQTNRQKRTKCLQYCTTCGDFKTMQD